MVETVHEGAKPANGNGSMDLDNQLVARGEDARSGRAPVPAFEALGIKLVAWSFGRATITFTADARHHNPMGTLHGAFLAGLVDTAMGMCHVSTLRAGESFTTLELSTRYVRPVWSGDLTAEARVVHRGRTIAQFAAEVRDDQGRLVATATSTSMTLAGRAGTNR